MSNHSDEKDARKAYLYDDTVLTDGGPYQVEPPPPRPLPSADLSGGRQQWRSTKTRQPRDYSTLVSRIIFTIFGISAIAGVAFVAWKVLGAYSS